MLSVIIVTYNNKAQAAACLASVYLQHGDGLEVVVVDNGSADGTPAMIKAVYPQARLIENKTNGGPCRARNQGLEVARGDWVLTLDSDVVLEEGFVGKFWAAAAGFSRDVGMVQPNILGPDGLTVYSQGIYLSFIRRFFDVNRGRTKDFKRWNGKDILGPCAAAAFYRRRMLELVKEGAGYFDERFFFLVEDVDLAWRAHKRGWKAVFLPELECRHAGDGSKTNKVLRQYLSWRNRYLMISKNEGVWSCVLIYLVAAPYELARLAYVVLFNKYIWVRLK